MKKKYVVKVKLLIMLLTMAIGFVGIWGASMAAPGTVNVVEVQSTVNPVVAEFIIKSIQEAESEGAGCLVIQLDTPGGLDLAMRDIIKAIFASRVPVVVYVSPSGARAGSAGVLITLAAHVGAMAPGTNIGAAHPVAMGGGKMDKEMKKKVENDAVAYIEGIANKRGKNVEWARLAVLESVSVTAEEALKLNVIDVVSTSLNDLLNQLDGREVEIEDEKIILETKGASIKEIKMGFRHRVLDALSNPNVAYILMMIGMWGIFFELSNPGSIFPGVIGGICIILAFIALQTLPINYGGVLLIILALVLFIAEIKITSYGLLTVGGVISMTLGSIMLIDKSVEPYVSVSLKVIIPMVVFTTSFFLLALALILRVHRSKPKTGKKGIVGEVGKAVTRIDPEGKVFIHGEYWNVICDESVEEGEKVEVVKVEGMEMKVKKIT